MPKTQGANWKAILFWGIVLGLLSAGVYIYVGQPDILAFIQNPQFDLSFFQNLTFDKVVAFLKDYGWLITAGFAGITAIYGLYQKVQKANAEAKLVESQVQAQIQQTELSNSVIGYKTAAETWKTKYDALVNSDSSASLTSKVQELTKQNELLTARYTEAQNVMNVVRSPTIDQQVKNVRNAGYTVQKQVE